MSSWHSYSSIYNLGHRAIIDLLKGPVLVEEKVDGCVSVNTRILTADLRYVRAGDLTIGDSLIGFDDKLNNPRLRTSIVTHAAPFSAPTLSVNLVDGRAIPATVNHPWLVRQKLNNNGKKWVQTIDLKPGMRIVAFPVWDSKERTEQKGYLAGAYDGEASLVRSGDGRILSFYQRLGSFDNQVIRLLSGLGYVFRRDVRRRKKGYSTVAATILEGGWPKILEFLGDIRPIRLLEQAYKIWLNAPMNGIADVEVESVNSPHPNLSVMGLSTSTGTYIADGLFSHNSQFSFGVFEDPVLVEFDVDGSRMELKVRSKGSVMNPDAPEKMFAKGVEHIKSIAHMLKPEWTYRGEYLQKPKHNALAYGRVPNGHIILFDINIGEEEYLDYESKAKEAARLGLEVVPLMHDGYIRGVDDILGFLDRESVLGNQKIEGVVVKPKGYELFGRDKKCLMGKYVSEAFKEVHNKEWKDANPTGKDILAIVGERYGTQARWSKAILHLREEGALENSPRDIGKIIKEIPEDIKKECEEELKDTLFAWAWPHIRRAVTKGLPEWYKERLLQQAFEEEVVKPCDHACKDAKLDEKLMADMMHEGGIPHNGD